jgi:hypothetical protein
MDTVFQQNADTASQDKKIEQGVTNNGITIIFINK